MSTASTSAQHGSPSRYAVRATILVSSIVLIRPGYCQSPIKDRAVPVVGNRENPSIEYRHPQQRQRDGHRRTGAFGRLGGDRATVLLDHVLDDRQAQPGALDRLVTRGRRAEEALEEVALLGLGDADAVVGHLDDDIVLGP